MKRLYIAVDKEANSGFGFFWNTSCYYDVKKGVVSYLDFWFCLFPFSSIRVSYYISK